jgi:hypothetical protein
MSLSSTVQIVWEVYRQRLKWRQVRCKVHKKSCRTRNPVPSKNQHPILRRTGGTGSMNFSLLGKGNGSKDKYWP